MAPNEMVKSYHQKTFLLVLRLLTEQTNFAHVLVSHVNKFVLQPSHGATLSPLLLRQRIFLLSTYLLVVNEMEALVGMSLVLVSSIWLFSFEKNEDGDSFCP